MPHIHELYDFVVSIFIVHLPAGRVAAPRVLLAFHKKYREWLPVGGHVDLDEDPEMALYKEIREECGLKVKVLAEKPAIAHSGVKPLPTPSYMDVHRIKGKHKHIALVYFGTTPSGRVKLEEREFLEYRWLKASELDSKELKLTRSIKFYCREALKAAKRA